MAYSFVSLDVHRVYSERRQAAGSGAESCLGPTTWKGMGVRATSCPPLVPIPALVILVIFGILWRQVGGCNVDDCFEKFERADADLRQANRDMDASREGLSRDGNTFDTSSNSKETECMLWRTYLKCIKDHSRGCKGNIKYQSVKSMVENKMRQIKCTATGPLYTPDIGNPRPPRPPASYICSFNGRKIYKHCGLFGDPHLRTFDDEFQTCKVQGAWPLIQNEYLTVQVTNDPVVRNGGATATSKLTVMIKKNEECAENKVIMYLAQTDHLPGFFSDGRTSYGTESSVELVEKDPGKHVEIYVRYIDTKILVRQIGRYFTFAISMPEEVVNSSRGNEGLDLCVRGCPKNERINYQQFLAEKKDLVIKASENEDVKMSRSDAVILCKDAKVVDFYFDSCVFDLMTTGDNNFTVAAYKALKDLLRLTPESAQKQENRTDLGIYDSIYSNAAPARTIDTSVSLRLLTSLTILLCLLLNPLPV